MALIQIETYDSDMAFGRIIETVDNDIINQNSGHYVGIKALIFNGIQNFPTYLGWSIIPTFVFFVPIGFVLMFKNWNYRIKTIFTALVLMSMPAFYAYSISIQDGRYIFFLYPLFVILSMITIEKIGKKFNQKIIFSVIISFIIISSCVYSVLKIDNTQSEEYLLIAQRISDTPKIINDYNKSQYLEPLNYPKEFNEFKKLYELDRIDKKSIRFSVPQQISKIPVSSHQNINDFINSNKNSITHIVVENEQESIFYDIFENEDKYSYLEKEFDSSSINFQYSVKIFKINHEKFFKNDIEK
jgi:hypothetical protein